MTALRRTVKGRLFAFTAEQAQDLAEHLGEVLRGAALSDAVAAIDLAAFPVAFPRRLAKATGSDVRKVGPLVTVSAGDFRREMRRACAHRKAIEEHAEALLSLLEQERPLWRTAGLDWAAVIRGVTTIAEAARAEADAGRPAPGRGRAADEWRDKLVATIYSVYPPGQAKKAEGSHFEMTVETVLGYCGRAIKDVHSLVRRALHRQPEAPFRLIVGARRRRGA